ncbi:antibiotic biosynthesis monooxygenase [Bosea sp. Tri-44]|uniref:antibiotic biosynthesis monooxygenase family protein n=1 Tax=Bosea sp. Tri-44 TaxID=1972137 RepID=UPI00100F0E32|nr:antibiotic biosynthesis monooxygenase [Bosea sp. Tri-44]RXT56262.1 antibiotic biosynthesis monooxygenase [Bosea sp. Tri-44]
MIYEIALLPVLDEHIDKFRTVFAKVAPLLISANGYCGHVLAQGVESPHRFNLIVKWQSLEDHTPGFEASENHGKFMLGLQEYFSAEPTVHHVEGPDFPMGKHLP